MGGLTAPTPARLRYELDLIRTRTDNLKAFLAGRFGGGPGRVGCASATTRSTSRPR